MRRLLFPAALPLLLMMLFAGDAGAQAVPLSGKALEKQIHKKILSLPYYDVFDIITFEVVGDTVVLSGKVLEPSTRTSAARAVKSINGAGVVVNEIEVLPLSSFDNGIRRQAINLISNTAAIGRYIAGPMPDMRIIVENGRITLEGAIANRADESLMKIKLRQIFGVFDVKSNLKIKSEM